MCAAALLQQHGLQGLASFSTTNAARDVLRVAKAENDSGLAPRQISTYGTSYGTLLANRVLQLDEAQNAADPVVHSTVLDGVVPPDMYSQVTQTFSATASLRAICEACTYSAACSAALGVEPCTTVAALMAALDSGYCAAAGIDSALARRMLGFLPSLLGAAATTMPLVHRLAACTDEDVPVLVQLKTIFETQLAPKLVSAFAPNGKGGGGSLPLLYNIMAGEMGHLDAPTAAPLLLRSFGLGIEDKTLALLFGTLNVTAPLALWPKYKDALAGKYPAALRSPVLLFNGGLDANTPVSYAFHALGELTAAARAGGAPVLPRLLIYAPGKHVVMQQPGGGAGVRCFALFLRDATDPEIDTCMPDVEVSGLFDAPPALDEALIAARDAAGAVSMWSAGTASAPQLVRYTATAGAAAATAAACPANGPGPVEVQGLVWLKACVALLALLAAGSFAAIWRIFALLKAGAQTTLPTTTGAGYQEMQ
jgi:hypothetical protein